MSSGFVSGGQDSDWVKAQQAVEERTRAKNAEGKQHDGKSLYEVLQQNKAAKQEAFEESIKLKNQFRSLDDDEVEFLDSVFESTRAKEAAVKKETAEQLEAFRKQQEATEKARFEEPEEALTVGLAQSPSVDDSWTTKKKRMREKGPEAIVGAKVRRLSSKDDQPPSKSVEAVRDKGRDRAPEGLKSAAEKGKTGVAVLKQVIPRPKLSPQAKSKSTPSGNSLLGLGDYSSDDD